MKNFLTVLAIFAAAASSYAQGTVVFANNVTGTLAARIYAPDLATPNVAKFGNTSTDNPAGTTVYTGAKLSGTGYTAQLWGAPGAGAALNSLQPLLDATTGLPVMTTLRTGSAAGVTLGLTTGDPYVQGAIAGSTATLQLRAWDNAGGTITSWAAATTRGESPLFNVANLGGGSITSPYLVGLQSFSLATTVPEPSTIALGVMGLSALLFRRRK